MSKPVPLNVYKQKLLKLRELGLYDADLRQKLTPGQKSAVTQLYNKYKSLINNQKQFTKLKLSKTERDYISDKVYYAKKSGFSYIPKQDYLKESTVVRRRDTDFGFIQDVIPFDFILKTNVQVRRRLSKKGREKVALNKKLTKLEAVILAPLEKIIEFVQTAPEIYAPYGYSFTWMFKNQNSFNMTSEALKDAMNYISLMSADINRVTGGRWHDDTPVRMREKLITGVRLVIRKYA